MESIKMYYDFLIEQKNQRLIYLEMCLNSTLLEVKGRMSELGWSPKGKLSVTNTMVSTSTWRGKFEKDGNIVEVVQSFNPDYSPTGYGEIKSINCDFKDSVFKPKVHPIHFHDTEGMYNIGVVLNKVKS